MEDELTTYEMACMRAELLGQSLPDKEEFEKKLAEHLKTQQSELEIEESKILEAETTQKKLNNFKKTACGSLSNIFKNQSTDKIRDDENNEGVTLGKNEHSSNSGENLTEMNKLDENVKAARNESLDINKKLNSNLDKLDALINKAESAEMAMASQTKQMKKFAK